MGSIELRNIIIKSFRSLLDGLNYRSQMTEGYINLNIEYRLFTLKIDWKQQQKVDRASRTCGKTAKDWVHRKRKQRGWRLKQQQNNFQKMAENFPNWA